MTEANVTYAKLPTSFYPNERLEWVIKIAYCSCHLPIKTFLSLSFPSPQLWNKLSFPILENSSVIWNIDKISPPWFFFLVSLMAVSRCLELCILWKAFRQLLPLFYKVLLILTAKCIYWFWLPGLLPCAFPCVFQQLLVILRQVFFLYGWPV